LGGVFEEFEHQLVAWRRKYEGRPKREMLRLLLLALEREEIVSVSYHEDVILRRLQTMPVAPEVADLIRHALIWTWKDEEIHAIYIRGAIFKFGTSSQKALAFAKQIAGAAGGWASSVRQHIGWKEGPLSRLLATLVVWSGFVTMRVPRDVLSHLDYKTFRQYCKYNVDAEKTAWLCFQRMIELVKDLPGVTPEEVDDFCRMQKDEGQHSKVFQILGAAFDEGDSLLSGETARTLAEKLSAVAEVFLPRALRQTAISHNPLGSGGHVWVARGKTAEEKLGTFNRLLDDAGLKDRIEKRALSLRKPISDLRIAIKPTFMLGYSHKDLSVITDPELVAELARYIRALGCDDIAVVEVPNLYDRFYGNRSVKDVAAYFRVESPDFRVVDGSQEQVPQVYDRGLGQYSVGKTWKESDFRISFSKMRSHSIEIVLLTVATLEGLGPRVDSFLFVERQANREMANMMLIDEFPPHFALIDAYNSAADGLLGMMGCPEPKSPGRFYAGGDAISVDIVAGRHMGLSNPKSSVHLKTACYWFGDPSASIQVIGPDEPIAEWRGPNRNGWVALLSLLAYPVYEYGSERGALFVPEMDCDAFPPINGESRWLRARRRTLQQLLGLRHRTPAATRPRAPR
jgi:uncharacterized protein (DUF362 family)